MSTYEVLDNSMTSSREIKKGEIVYDLTLHDYGAVQMDNKRTGVMHFAVTRNIDGSYPFFTIPVKHLRKLK